MKHIRRWSKILHRDLGYLFIGTSLIYGLSGIALNHLHDWNPNYVVTLAEFTTDINLYKTPALQSNILFLLDEIGGGDSYKNHYYPDAKTIKIFLEGGSSVVVDVDSGQGVAEFLKRRPVFYEVNYLHYNPNEWWMWFSDVYAGVLIFLAVSSFFMTKGHNGPFGRGGLYILLGFLMPLGLLILSQ